MISDVSLLNLSARWKRSLTCTDKRSIMQMYHLCSYSSMTSGVASQRIRSKTSSKHSKLWSQTATTVNYYPWALAPVSTSLTIYGCHSNEFDEYLTQASSLTTIDQSYSTAINDKSSSQWSKTYSNRKSCPQSKSSCDSQNQLCVTPKKDSAIWWSHFWRRRKEVIMKVWASHSEWTRVKSTCDSWSTLASFSKITELLFNIWSTLWMTSNQSKLTPIRLVVRSCCSSHK